MSEFDNKVFVDFNNMDRQGRVRLSTDGSLNDIKTKNIILKDGLELFLDDEDGLSTLGIAEFSVEENIWVTRIDWNSFSS